MRAEVAVEGGRRWGSVYRVGDLMGGQTREGNASPWVVCQAMVNGSQMSKLGFEHQALVRMHKNSVDVHSDYLPPTNRVPMHTCLLLDPSILVKCVGLGSLAIQPGEPPPLPHKYMGDGGSPNSSPPQSQTCSPQFFNLQQAGGISDRSRRQVVSGPHREWPRRHRMPPQL